MGINAALHGARNCLILLWGSHNDLKDDGLICASIRIHFLMIWDGPEVADVNISLRDPASDRPAKQHPFRGESRHKE